ISNLLVSNPLDEGIVIATSKGQDNITLVAGANHDVIEFAAGTGASVGRAEVYTVDLANLRLSNKQSFNIDGLTITNINGETGIVRAEAIADAIATYITTGALTTTQAAQFSIDGTLNSLTGDWAGARVAASGGVLTITSTLQRNIKDLSFSFGGNNSTNAPSDISASKFVQSKDATSGGISAVNQTEVTPAVTKAVDAAVKAGDTTFDNSGWNNVDDTTGVTAKVTIGEETYSLVIKSGGTSGDLSVNASLVAILNAGTSAGVTNITSITITDSNGDAVTAADYAAAVAAAGKFEDNSGITFTPTTTSTFAGTIGINSNTGEDTTWTMTAYQPTAAATYSNAFTFGQIGQAGTDTYTPAVAPVTKAVDAAVKAGDTTFDNSGWNNVDDTTGVTAKVTIGEETYSLVIKSGGTSGDLSVNASLVAILNAGTSAGVTNITSITITDSNGDAVTAADYAAAVAAAGKFEDNSGITFTPTTTSTFAGTIGINSNTGEDTTWTMTAYQPTSAGSPAIGTPASISEGVTNWQPTTQLKAAQQNIELLSLTVNGETYKVLVTNNSANDVTINRTTIESILDDTTSGNDYGIINVATGSASGTATTVAGGSNVWYKIVNSRNVEDIGISLGELLSGAGVKASLASSGTTGVILEAASDPADFTADASITLKTGRLHTSSNATWEISAPKGQAAVPETSVVNINIGSKAQTISITGEGMAADAVRDNVFALLTSGTLADASIASNVSINGAAYDASKASDYVKAFALGDGLSYVSSGSAGIDIVAAPGVSLADANISMSQTGQSAAVANQTWNIEGATPATNGEISVTFNALAAGQSYTFNGKTIIATKDLSANKVAEAFTLDSDDLYDGAVIVSNFDADAIGEDVLYYINGSTLTIQGTSLESIGASASNVVTGTGSLGVNTNGIKTNTTDGNDGAGSRSDSYVTFGGNLGSEGAAASIVANTSAMDSITNFDVANDGLRLKMASGGYYGEGNVTSGFAIDTLVYVDALGTRIVADSVAGVLSFDVLHSQNNDSTTTANAITLDQKLYVATNGIGDNAIAGFAHEGDFYVVATGANGDATTDDIVVRLAGVGGVTDISTILA
ncbi:MAG: hypothetical protein K2N69_05690, partial [Helicobacter sp.]|nr:hypothetical protein [Helicobacter sp.]